MAKSLNGMSMRLRSSFVLLAAACFLFLARQVLAEHEVTFELVASFDYPKASATIAKGINERGDVVGTFVDKFGLAVNGFVRFADGTFSDPVIDPEGRYTYLEDINNTGTICGEYTLS